MKEKKTVPKKTIVIDIKLTRGLIVALSCALVIVALLAHLTLTGERTVAAEAETSGEASPAQSTGMRQFYLTQSQFQGDEALTACAAGYHMASLWEIADPSNLKYNTSLGSTADDSGQGPPTGQGWVRTGYMSDDGGPPGQANCAVWTIDDMVGRNGTVVSLSTDWTGGTQDIGVWSASVSTCFSFLKVWCIED